MQRRNAKSSESLKSMRVDAFSLQSCCRFSSQFPSRYFSFLEIHTVVCCSTNIYLSVRLEQANEKCKSLSEDLEQRVSELADREKLEAAGRGGHLFSALTSFL